MSAATAFQRLSWGGRSCPLAPAPSERGHFCCSAWIKKSCQSPSVLTVSLLMTKKVISLKGDKSQLLNEDAAI